MKNPNPGFSTPTEKKGQKNMRKTFYPALVKAAENITRAELSQAPELPTLIALDAVLHATTTFIELNYHCLGNSESENRDIADGVEEHIIDSICILARALRSNLSSYYAAIQESCDYHTNSREPPF